MKEIALERFKELLKGKSLREKCELRLDYETVHYYNNGKRTIKQIAEHTKTPFRVVSLFLEITPEVWDEFLKIGEYVGWIGQVFGKDFQKAVICRFSSKSLLKHNDLQG